MPTTPPDAAADLLDALEEVERLVTENRVQPLHQLAETTTMSWMRVVEGKEALLPRLGEDGTAPDAFHYGLELRPEQRMEAVPAPDDAAAVEAAVGERLAALEREVTRYLAHPGYRSSADRCDRMMVELSRCSRALAALCGEAEARAAAPEAGPGAAAAVGAAREALFCWEPRLNEAIVNWQQNWLTAFDGALRRLADLLAMTPAERAAERVPAGYPLRGRGRPRIKVSGSEPLARPLRGKSLFSVRFAQLLQRIEELMPLPEPVWSGLAQDARHFIAMTRRNWFMSAGPPGFMRLARPGLPLIRGKPATHPFLLDPMDYFKKAVLFHNRTYTADGGGLDAMYLQVRQLERFYKFHSSAHLRPLRAWIEDCLRAWDENRWDAFTEGLLTIGGFLRGEAERGPWAP